MMTRRRTRFRRKTAPAIVAAALLVAGYVHVVVHAAPVSPAPASSSLSSPAPASATVTVTERATQQQSAAGTTETETDTNTNAKIKTDFLTSNSRATIRAMERHLFSPEVRSQMRRIFSSRVVHDGNVHTFESYRYTFQGFWRNWKRMMKDGVPAGAGATGCSGGINGEGRFVLFAGDDVERYANITRDAQNKNEPKREIRIFGYEYGLANMAAFLSQAMVDGIYDDACDERNEQEIIDRNGKPTGIFPKPNACGQYNSSYEDLACPPGEEYMQCPPLPPEKTIDSDPENTLSDEKHAMVCGPVNTHPSLRNQKNELGRDNVEGCCWWGRGPLHTKGVCNMGKLNHHIGAAAFEEGRITLSTPGVYPDVDFCANPEAVCRGEDEDMAWTVAMFEWAERIQRYRSKDGSWDYGERLVDFVNGGMHPFEYYGQRGEGYFDTDRSYAFIHAVSSIVDRGCHNSPNCDPFGGEVNKLSQRRVAFSVALSALNIPTMRTELVVEQALDHLRSREETIRSNLLVYRSGREWYPSRRYIFDDWIDALRRFSRPYGASDIGYPVDETYFRSDDHDPLYMGDPYVRDGHKYGLANVALFLSNGLELSVEKDETCDELNEHDVSGKIPMSNSCGSRGLSYQDMACADDDDPRGDMACPVDPDMFITAVTGSREFGAPPPLQCGPRRRIPYTGYWDFDAMRESTEVAYANTNARVDVEGCCWWGRGVLQTKGVCSFGRLNYYLGKRAADEGRESLFPNVDFCSNPEAVCGSQYKHETMWMSGLFEWVDRVQSYDRGGFNYMERLKLFADEGMKDDVFIKHVGAIVQSGCHDPPCEAAGCLDFPCDGASPVNENAGVTKAFRMFFQLDLWDSFPVTPGGTIAPSPAPTQCQENCTEWPSESPLPPTAAPSKAPVVIPTSIPSEAPTREMDAKLATFEDMAMYLERRRVLIENEIFVSESDSGLERSKMYTLDGFLVNLKELATVGVDDMMFYVGQGRNGNFDHGLVNIALFFAHAMTRGIKFDTCEEVNHHLVNGRLPLSNACGQHGRSYGDDICPLADAAMECRVDGSMNVRQASVGNTGSPPFFCAPKSEFPFTGYYDPFSDTTVSNAPFPNEGGRVDVEGCCFWGRGILLNQGICDIGRFNYIFGLPAFMDGRSSGRYNIDFCSHPEALCSDHTIPATGFNKFPTTVKTSEVRYFIGLLYWADYVQGYNWGYWNYMEKLKLFADGGMKDDSFVDEFSEIVIDSRRDGPLRKAHFKRVLEILFMGAPTQSPTEDPTWKPTGKPTPRPSWGAQPVDGRVVPLGISDPDFPPAPGPTPRPTPRPNRPVSFDLSNPRPSFPSIPANTIVDLDQKSNAPIFSGGWLWPLLIFSCSILLFIAERHVG